MSRFTRQCTFERSPDQAAPEDRADLTLAMAFASDTPTNAGGVSKSSTATLNLSAWIASTTAPRCSTTTASTRFSATTSPAPSSPTDTPCVVNVVVAWAADEGRTIALIAGGHLAKASVGYEIHAVIEQSTTKDGKSIERKLDGQQFGRVLSRCQRDTPAIWPPSGVRSMASPVPWNGLRTRQRSIASSIGSRWKTRSSPSRPMPASALAAWPTTNPQHLRSAGSAGNPDPLEHKRMDNPTPNNSPRSARHPRQGPGPHRLDRSHGQTVRQLRRCRHGCTSHPQRHRRRRLAKLIMDHVAKRGTTWTPEIGMSAQEVKRYSIVRAIRAMLANDWSGAGLEREASNAFAEKASKPVCSARPRTAFFCRWKSNGVT